MKVDLPQAFPDNFIEYYLPRPRTVHAFIELPDRTAYGGSRVVVDFSHFAMAYY